MNLLSLFHGLGEAPGIRRVRHEVKTRYLQVVDTTRVTPGVVRVTLAGPDLADFPSLGFDDHVKLLVPVGSRVERRDYTPRRFSRSDLTLVLDFALHDAGPATRWAEAAQVGDRIEVAGPKGSSIIAPEVRRWLMVADETGLPAVGRRIEEADAGTCLQALLAVVDDVEEQRFATRADLDVRWVHRPKAAAHDSAPLVEGLRSLEIAPDTFVWVAAEAGVARAVRDHLIDERGHPRSWLKAGGYWVNGQADAHERIG